MGLGEAAQRKMAEIKTDLGRAAKPRRFATRAYLWRSS
jgi:hypothetical protein